MVAMQAMAGAVDAGLTLTDLAWEQAQEMAVRAYRAGGCAPAATHWGRAMAIAQEHFAPVDPRRAASFTNCGLLLRRQGQHFQAGRHFRLALETWDRTWRWVGLMTQPGRPDQCYDQVAQAQFRALLAQGRAATVAIDRADRLPHGHLERWLEEGPRRGADLRKLLGAVLLIASRPA